MDTPPMAPPRDGSRYNQEWRPTMDDRKLLPTLSLALLMLLAAGCGGTAIPPTAAPVEPSAAPTLLLYDDDGSRDGTAALLYLLSQPDISIEAVTISYGEAHP